MTTNPAFITAVLNEVNKLRAQHGLKPVTLNRELTAAAYMHSRDMSQNKFFGHEGSNGSSFGERAADVGYNGAAGENAALGQATPESVVQSWYNSPGHRRNMLNPNVTEMGVGYYRPDGDTSNNHYWTQKFGSGDGNSESFIPDDVLQAINGPNYTNIDPQTPAQIGTIGNDILNGTSNNNVLHGSWGNDTLNGLAGNDSLYGGLGNDLLTGGDGDDALHGGAGNDILNGLAGNDILKGGGGQDTLNGGAGNDVLEGNGGHDLLNGEAGNDTLKGNAWSNDTLNGGEGDDIIDGGGYANTNTIDILTGGAGADTFVLKQNSFAYQGAGHAVIKDFERGVDKLDGLWGHTMRTQVVDGRTDTVITRKSDTNDILAIVEGVDLTAPLAITGTDGNDSLTGTQKSDTIYGRGGNDSLTGKGGNDSLYGNDGNDSLYGNAWSNDLLVGGAGDDILNGNAYTGSGETDTYTGGSGADTFVFSQKWGAYRGEGHAVVTDFEVGTDRLDFGGSWSMNLGSRTNSDGTVDTLISRGDDLVTVLQGVQLTEGQFQAARI